MSALELQQSDPQLKSVDYNKYFKLADEQLLNQTVAALESKLKAKVTVVNNKVEALKVLNDAIPKNAEVNVAGSTTLREIGFMEHLKTTKDWRNLHGEVLSETDPAKQAELRRKHIAADYFVSSVSAISGEGDLVVVDLSGSRTGAFTFAAGNLIVVAGSNKITPTYDEAVKRTYDFALPVESARCRVVYKLPSSAVNNFVAVRGPNPMGAPGRIQIILVKELLGY